MPECHARKTSGDGSRAGELDIDCCWQGLAVKLEVKRPGRRHGYANQEGRPTKLQTATMNRWKAAGAITGIVYSVDDVKMILAAAAGGRKNGR